VICRSVRLRVFLVLSAPIRPGLIVMEYTKSQRLHYVKIAVESINMRLCELTVFMEYKDEETLALIEELKSAAIYLIEDQNKVNNATS